MSRESDALLKLGAAVPKDPLPFTMPHARQKAFLVGPSHAFVRDPNARGRWILVPRPVVEIPCNYCKAEVYEPCRNPRRGNTWTQIHIARRISNRSRRLRGVPG